MPIGGYRVPGLPDSPRNRYENPFDASGRTVMTTNYAKYGSTSCRFPGWPNAVFLRTTIPHTIIPNNNNWTVEGWVMTDANPFNGYQTVFTLPNFSVSLRGFNVTNSMVIEYFASDINNTNSQNWNGDVSFTANNWVHFAIVSNRGPNSANYTLFGSTTANLNANFGGPSNQLIGHIDNFRISKCARYVSNFTLGNLNQLKNDPQTVFLLDMEGPNNSQYFQETTTENNTITDVYFNSNTNSTGSTITIPNNVQVDDYAILFDFSTTTTDTTPTNWTSISKATTTGIRTNISYKKMVSGDLGATITGMGGTTRKILLTFRPNAAVSSVTLSTPGSQATTAAPSNQTISMSGQNRPIIGFACYASTGSVGTRGWSGGTPVEFSNVSTSSIFVKALVYNQEFTTTPSNATISMSDNGTNTLQTFYMGFS
jgi:hypothetical protein